MNKQQAIEILNNLQQVFRDEEDIENALDFAIKELGKDDEIVTESKGGWSGHLYNN